MVEDWVEGTCTKMRVRWIVKRCLSQLQYVYFEKSCTTLKVSRCRFWVAPKTGEIAWSRRLPLDTFIMKGLLEVFC